MAGSTYVQITREDLEKWLEGLPWKWSRVAGKAGIYHIHLSDHVAVKLSSTIGASDNAMGYADASMNLELVARSSGKILNRKARDRSHFKRTKNWQKTWFEGIQHWAEVYRPAAAFYDKIAQIDDRETYAKSFIEKIEAIPNWQTNEMLVGFRNKLLKGDVLSDKQEIEIEKAMKAKAPAPKRTFTPEQEKFLARLETLRQKADEANDTWLIGFLNNITRNIENNRPLTDPQKEALKKNLVKYKAGSIQGV